MNPLLKNYLVDVTHPEVSGLEHLQMLRTRSQLAQIEAGLSAEERAALAEADHRLALHAAQFAAELARFADLTEERRRLQPRPDEWWWYLDVLAQAPLEPPRQRQPEPAPA